MIILDNNYLVIKVVICLTVTVLFLIVILLASEKKVSVSFSPNVSKKPHRCKANHRYELSNTENYFIYSDCKDSLSDIYWSEYGLNSSLNFGSDFKKDQTNLNFLSLIKLVKDGSKAKYYVYTGFFTQSRKFVQKFIEKDQKYKYLKLALTFNTCLHSFARSIRLDLSYERTLKNHIKLKENASIRYFAILESRNAGIRQVFKIKDPKETAFLEKFLYSNST